MTTTQTDTQVEAASNGGQSVPVKLVLQAKTAHVTIEMLVAAVSSAAPNPAPTEMNVRKNFTLYWAFSYQDFAGVLATVPSALRNCIKTHSFSFIQGQLSQSIQVYDRPKGQYLYSWFEYPASVDQYTVTTTATEVVYS